MKAYLVVGYLAGGSHWARESRACVLSRHRSLEGARRRCERLRPHLPQYWLIRAERLGRPQGLPRGRSA